MEGFTREVVTTGGEEEDYIIERRDAFFVAVLGKIGIDETLQHDNPYIRVVSRSLGFEGPDKFYPSDDVLHRLLVWDETVALVSDCRNDMNYHEVTFFERTPSQQLTDSIARMLEVRRTIMLQAEQPACDS